MDRRNNNETAGDLTDEQFRRALEVIIDSYKGAPADRLYRDAIGCFECLIEISNNTDAILTFARRHDIDLKYLVDGANFVISKMHFNPESNYYITLGLSQNVSSEEIRERWKKLMLLYHPDRQGGDNSWVSERAKKVNEAYSILKDNEKRQSFDRRLREQTMTRKPVPQPRTNPGAASSRSGRKISRDPEWDRKKKNIPKLLVGAYLIAAVVFLGYIYLQNDTEPLESALSRREGLSAQTNLISGAASVEEKSNSTVPVGPHHPTGNRDKGSINPQSLLVASPHSKGQKTQPHSEMPKHGKAGLAASPAAPENAPENVRIAARQETGTDKVVVRGDSAPKKTMPFVPQPTSGTVLGRQARPQEPEPKLSVQLFKDMPAADYSTRKPEPPRSFGQKAPSAHPAPNVQTAELTHEEVEDFMKHYSSAYSRGDLNTFMSFLSKSVVENNRLRYNEVREAYRETFSEKIDYYRVNKMIIMLNGQSANISGYYDLNRYTSTEDRWIRYSGRIQWNISKENNELKIISINYDK